MTDNTQPTASHNFSKLEEAVVNAIQDRKGINITKIDFSKLESAPSRSFLICEGKSTSQVSAIADNIRESVREKTGTKPYNYDGYRNSQWIVIDYGDLIVHVFVPEFREFYNLEDLWSDADLIELPNLD
ncbi:MAG: ribosome silencing factor [Bacteroidales bacterium]|nr:ribosome silencing factor [Bacteroidales bacterium]MBD5206595.1 ribosome silencing factor [Bacteroidales bacterium]MBD5224073.1 ribosome silencing factor [Bacteroidales bacterium]MBD5301895.1 ribosome silencing factor [Bacteroides sp.]